LVEGRRQSFQNFLPQRPLHWRGIAICGEGQAFGRLRLVRDEPREFRAYARRFARALRVSIVPPRNVKALQNRS
jgi:hypothetical protein